MMSASLLLFLAISASSSRILHAQTRMTSSRVGTESQANAQKVTLDDLPYGYDALEPHIGEETLRTHHGKHHAKYVATTNSLVLGTDMENMDADNKVLFNNAAQCFNHDFYWKCMKPGGGGVPTGRLLNLIVASFGSFDNFRSEFANAGNTAFGSGWAWLVWNSGLNKLQVMKTIGAGCPLTDPTLVPVLTMDVWEHAYYLDYKNMRTTYVDAFLDSLVNWDFVASQLYPLLNPNANSHSPEF